MSQFLSGLVGGQSQAPEAKLPHAGAAALKANQKEHVPEKHGPGEVSEEQNWGSTSCTRCERLRLQCVNVRFGVICIDIMCRVCPTPRRPYRPCGEGARRDAAARLEPAAGAAQLQRAG